jgi:hypothetical protein
MEERLPAKMGGYLDVGCLPAKRKANRSMMTTHAVAGQQG